MQSVYHNQLCLPNTLTRLDHVLGTICWWRRKTSIWFHWCWYLYICNFMSRFKCSFVQSIISLNRTVLWRANTGEQLTRRPLILTSWPAMALLFYCDKFKWFSSWTLMTHTQLAKRKSYLHRTRIQRTMVHHHLRKKIQFKGSHGGKISLRFFSQSSKTIALICQWDQRPVVNSRFVHLLGRRCSER